MMPHAAAGMLASGSHTRAPHALEASLTLPAWSTVFTPTLPLPPVSQVPRALADKVKAYYDYVVEREVQADEADIIQGLSASLRTQIVLHLYAEALEKVPFFRWAGTRYLPHRQLVLSDRLLYCRL